MRQTRAFSSLSNFATWEDWTGPAVLWFAATIARPRSGALLILLDIKTLSLSCSAQMRQFFPETLELPAQPWGKTMQADGPFSWAQNSIKIRDIFILFFNIWVWRGLDSESFRFGYLHSMPGRSVPCCLPCSENLCSMFHFAQAPATLFPSFRTSGPAKDLDCFAYHNIFPSLQHCN